MSDNGLKFICTYIIYYAIVSSLNKSSYGYMKCILYSRPNVNSKTIIQSEVEKLEYYFL